MVFIRRVVLAAVALLSSTSMASGLELELGGGGGATWQTLAPALTGRVGYDFIDHVTASVRVITLTGMHGQTLSVGSSDVTSGYQAWAALAEVKVHTSGMFQLSAGLGLGLGQPSVAEPWTTSPPGSQSSWVPYGQASVGGRFMMMDSLWLGPDLTFVAWNLASNPVASRSQGGPDYGAVLTLSVGGRLDIL